MNKAQKALVQMADERDWHQFHTPENLAKSIVIEAAELLECFQWSTQAENMQDVREELADVISYAYQLCSVLGLDPETIVLEKLEKTKKKYPVSQAKGRSTKYTVLAREREEANALNTEKKQPDKA